MARGICPQLTFRFPVSPCLLFIATPTPTPTPIDFPENTFNLLNMSKARPLDPKVLRHCAGALRTLSHPDRLRIVEALENGPLDVSELTTRLRRPQATVSQHLMRLRAHGLVAAEREGRGARYRVAHAGCLSILGCIRSQFSK